MGLGGIGREGRENTEDFKKVLLFLLNVSEGALRKIPKLSHLKLLKFSVGVHTISLLPDGVRPCHFESEGNDPYITSIELDPV